MNTCKKGKEGEERAAAVLEAAGMCILARNVRYKTGEIDLVALEGETIVFVEVKTWSVFGINELQYGINGKKQRRIIETAKYFLFTHREYNCMSIRFDVIFIGPDTISHFVSAFVEQI